MSYSIPTTAVYRFAATDVSSAAVVGRFIGPAGKTGRVMDIGFVVTTGVTVAANTVTVGTEADNDAYATVSIPVSAANSVKNGATLVSGHVVAADTSIVVASGGECTAGAGDILVTVEWA